LEKSFFGKGFKKDILEEIEIERERERKTVSEITEWSERFGLGLPKSWKELQKLKEIEAIYKGITYIPESIGNLSNLKYLYFSSNKISEIPESIGNLSNLKELYFSSNKISEIPESIGNLSNLETLYFRGETFFSNQITDSEKEKLKRLLPNTEIYF
jgi:Leucine-rich repeat (LRR) protein